MGKDWISFIVDETIKNCGNREIVLWGRYSVSDSIRKNLENKYRKCIAFYVDSDTSKQDKQLVQDPSVLKNLSRKYYVVIPIAFYQSIKDRMEEYGYQKDQDYHYFCDCIVKQTENYYEDSHGNRLIGNWAGVKFVFSGFESTIIIGMNCVLTHEIDLYVHNNSTITIGEGTIFSHKMIIWAENNSIITIGKNCLFDRGSLYVKDHASLCIGDDITVGNNCVICTYKETSINIGNDCMFSHDIEIRSNDAHSIFDVKTGENINSTKKIRKSRKVIIKDHVWLGANVVVLYNAVVESGSIIGACSLVKSHIPNNCIAAGVPAKVIRTDVAWSREDGAEDISACGEMYVNYTDVIDKKE